MKKVFFAALATLSAVAADPVTAQEKSYKVVDAADLAIGSGKYRGKDIEVRGWHCYYADVGDYRCTSGAGVSIFSPMIVPKAAREWVEDKCDSVRTALTSNACLTSIRLNFSEAAEDLTDGFRRRMILKPSEITLPARKDAKAKR